MIEIIDLFLNQYLRIFVGIVLIGLIIFSLFFKLRNKLKAKFKFNIKNKGK
jgi:hypothetical protein